MPSGSGIEPGDLAPCVAQPEIWIRGHAWHPPAEGAPSVRVRLAVARGAELVMRKSVEIATQHEPFVAPYLHALAPLSRKWPVRTRLLGVFNWENLERSPIAIPDVFDWAYFQAAPVDQQMGALRGDEWIRLEAIHSTIHKFDTQLPAASCAIMLFGQVDPFRQGVALRSRLDTVQIDADHGTCSLVFRGHTPIPASIALEELQFVAGLGLPDRSIPKLEPRMPERCSASMNETFAINASILDSVVKPRALPFHDGMSSLATARTLSAHAQDKRDAGQTFVVDAPILQSLSQQALPFQNGQAIRRDCLPVVEPRHEAHVLGPVVEQVVSTFMLSDELLAQITKRPTTPFAGGIALPPRDDPQDALAGLPFKPAPANANASGKLGAIFLSAMGVL